MKTTCLYFSPTGGTKKIVDAIVEGMKVPCNLIDLCVPDKRTTSLSFNSDDLVVFVFPVYAGRVVRVPRYYFDNIDGGGAQAVCVVTYGNRAYDDALIELVHLTKDARFLNTAAAAFVCEHSFDIGLATGRPDVIDIDIAKNFGNHVIDLVNSNQLIGTSKLMASIPGEYPPKTKFRKDFGGPLVPTADIKCTFCKKCALDCPVQAIDVHAPQQTSADKCITCYRCIKFCPVSARRIKLKGFDEHLEMLSKKYMTRKEPECYF